MTGAYAKVLHYKDEGDIDDPSLPREAQVVCQEEEEESGRSHHHVARRANSWHVMIRELTPIWTVNGRSTCGNMMNVVYTSKAWGWRTWTE